MQKCRICNGTDFYKEAGYFFCQTCQTQNEDIREEVLELRIDTSTRLRKTRIRRLRSDKSGDELGWTSWELYNFVLIGLTNELIELGVSSDIKLTVLQLWTTYLGKLEVAFISTKKKSVPKLARRYNKKDAEIIYGKVQSQKRARKRRKIGSSTNTSMISGYQSEGSSMRELSKNKRLLATADYDRFLQSQGSSEGDGFSLFSQSAYSIQSSSIKSSDNEGKVQFSSHAKEEARKIKRLSKNIPRYKRASYRINHISTQYKIGPNIITPMKLWAIVYIALRIHDHPIQLGDMLRYGREGHLSYYKLDHLIPPEVNLTKRERNFLSQNVEITHKGMRRIIASIAKLLGVWDIVCPDFLPLISRYCQELGLPKGIKLYTERLIALSPPKMIFNGKKSYIPNYEGRAIAFIIVVLKTLLALDDITEYQVSRTAEKINSIFLIGWKKMQHEKYCSSQQKNNSYDIILNKPHKRIGAGECKCYENNFPCIIVHGGAGNFNDSIDMEKMTGCKKAAINGYRKLIDGESSVNVVERTLWWLECDEFFNCSYGSVLNEIGKVQMDASIMDGLTFKCGSVAAVSDIEHPITLAKYVLNNFPNSIFVGEGAKNLAKYANLNWLSEGNMESPMARIAYHLGKGEYEVDVDNISLLGVDMLTNSFGTVGCVAYDGHSIAAGTTTGGLNKKLVGRVGDTPLLGCGTYATKDIGCSVTGHGESIMKLGLARAIAEDVQDNFTGEEALYKHFSCMLNKFEKTGGGIILQSNGRWATHFTSDKMPYAVIENDVITFGVKLHEERRELYGKQNTKNCDVAIKQGLLTEKLFSFQEWQKYIECRKTILTHSHFPTKMKYGPDTHGIDDLYLQFLEFITSKADNKETDIKNSKHFLPEQLVNAMTTYISNLNINDFPPKAIDVFPPSLTPLHSYLQHLLDHPLYDIPSVVRNDFFLTKVGYMTKPDSLIELAMECDINLEIIDSSLHFLEKVVPPFEQPRMPSIEKLKQLVDVQDDSNTQHTEGSENLNDYLHRKIPCRIKFNNIKEKYYDNVRSSTKNFGNIDLGSDFGFSETLPNGRLAIPNDSDSEDEKEDINLTNRESILLGKKLCDKYNLHLSFPEKESINESDISKRVRFKKHKLQFARNAKGHFIKRSGVSVNVEENNEDSLSETDLIFQTSTQISMTEKMHNDIDKIMEEELPLCEGIDINDITIDDVDTAFPDLNDYFNLSEISLFRNSNDNSMLETNLEKDIANNKYQFFRPFKHYWMYHCIFSRVKPKNFAVFERSLPRNFRWLLNECALGVEMSAEDLYEEVCLIETYHANILKSTSEDINRSSTGPMSKNQINLILSRW